MAAIGEIEQRSAHRLKRLGITLINNPLTSGMAAY